MRKGLLNIITGITGQMIALAIGFIIPRLFLANYGSEMHGLISSTSQILTYLGLFEAGVGTATIQALYGSVGKNDTTQITGIISATNHYYKKTGLVYLIVLIPISLMYPALLNTSISGVKITLIMLLLGISGALPFFFHSKYTLLLGSESKFYIINTVNIVSSIFSGIARIILIKRSVNIVALQLVFILLVLIQIAVYKVYFNKKYKWLDLSAKPDYQSISQKNSALVHQISSLIFGNTDIIIISFFLGLKSVSIYAIYSLVFTAVGTLTGNIYTGVRSKLGQIYNIDKEHYKIVFSVFEPLFTAISFAIICVAYVVVLPFIKLYTLGIEGTNYIDSSLPLCFVTIQLLTAARLPIFDTVYFAGHIKATQWHSLIESIINIFASLILIKVLGIYGVLIGTSVALLFRTIIMARFVYEREKTINLWRSLRIQILNFCIFGCCVLLSKIVTFTYNSYLDILLGILVYMFIFISIFLGTNAIVNNKAFKNYLQYRSDNINIRAC